MSKRMKQMGILSALLTFVCLALLISVGYTDRPNVSATVYVNAKNAGLSEKVASNTKILQKILDSNTTGTTHIIIPESVKYLV